ncbi:39S ribosomal protein L43, mitochondrial [Anopheles cruzii]|uniref:39S ribosomal protein L43, mitochondrial n=1 Tax=Anopheles cruzii TaxID=68878 RepID=UPI0022EC5589|nr:39S ribosomal protein L43, mitochondrial [Anopheles cruzii]
MSNAHLFLKSGFPRAPLQNGIGRYVCQLQRITLKYCKSSGSSKGMREFLEHELVDFSRSNPGVAVYIKPRRHRTAVISAEFLNGERTWINCRNHSRDEISKWVHVMKQSNGQAEEMRLRKQWHTDIPSVQGPWTPFTHRHHSANTTEFPCKELSKLKITEPSATEKLLELYQAQREKVSKSG